MAVLPIVTYPDPRLREPTFDVEALTDEVRTLIADLTDTMYAQNGAGIAAIQVGRLERMFLIDAQAAGGTPHDPPIVCINPEIVETSGGDQIAEEGCLSFPNVFVEIKRPRYAKVRARNAEFEEFEIAGNELLGRALQHEHDHLTGRLLIDMVGMVKKEMIKRKMKRFHTKASSPA